MVDLLMQLDLDKLKENDLKSILKGMGIEVQGVKNTTVLKRKLLQNVPELRLKMEARYVGSVYVFWFYFFKLLFLFTYTD